MNEQEMQATISDPYDDWTPPPARAERPIDPTRAAQILSRYCKGYQTVDGTAEGRITRTVWSGFILFDGDMTHPVLRYWTDGGGSRAFLSECPRIDREMPERPWGQS